MEQKKEINLKETLRDAAQAVVQDPITLTVDITPQGRFHALLQRLRLAPRKRTLCIRPATLGTLQRISALVLTIDQEALRKGMLSGSYELADKHAPTIARIIALAVTNRRALPSAGLERFILEQFSPGALVQTLGIVMHQLDIKSFTTAIVSIRGLNLLEKREETSPETPAEMIAPGMPSAAQ
ncbi:hypothetical protein [Flaviaesturariibacter amylovorans]|uniref:Uncharacterized protein n=1 Tax=Flaviaesturariibacter amylovorans TaxID=1084520 RepID=A0ABP8GQN4_9BACT